MGVVLENIFTEILCLLSFLLWLLYWYMTKNYQYWEKRGVPCKKAEFPFGSTEEMVLTRTFSAKAHDNIYKQFPNERFYGLVEFRRPTLVVRDPELIKTIMVKDFQHFVDRPTIMGNPKEYIMLHLLNLKGTDWKKMRAKLSPTFSSGKIKLMFELMEKYCEQLNMFLERKNGKPVDVKDTLARFTLDVIACCAFGIESDSLKDENAKFFRILQGLPKTTPFRYIRRLFILAFPAVLKLLRYNIIKTELRDFLTNTVRDTIDYRQKNNIKRNDFIGLLINTIQNKDDLQSTGVEKNDASDGLTIEQMTAQSFVFIIGGFETSSSFMSFCLFELACNQEIQEELYQKIQEVADNNGGKISYHMLMEISLLDQVINETLRLYGTAQALSRICTLPYKVPGTDLVLEKGLRIVIPLYSLHHDPKYYPEPYVFKPERFNAEENKKRHPSVFIPFGDGPRNCIGMRFGLVVSKVALATLILNFQVFLSPDQEVPMEIHKQSISLMPANPVWLMFVKRKT